MITAKVILSQKQTVNDDETVIKFHGDYANGANSEWAKYTPHIDITMTVKNEVAGKMVQGGHYTLSFELQPLAVNEPGI